MCSSPKMVRQVVHQRETAHQINLCAGGVEDARVSTFILFIGDIDEAFVDLPDHLRIDGDLLIEGAIFSDGEVVVFKKIKNPLETLIRNLEIVFSVEGILCEQTAVEIRG